LPIYIFGTMRIHLHLGMPKTGTSAIQGVLLKAYGSPEPQRIWYPIPERMGDGHADLVLRATGYGNRLPEPAAIEDVARRALDAGCLDLILDSEAFTYAVLSDRAPQIAALAQFGEVVPIVTLTPIGKRTNSLWQEAAKNLAGGSMESARSVIVDALVELPLITAATLLFPHGRVFVICVDSEDDPGVLFRHFSAVTGFDVPQEAPTGADAAANRSLYRLEADIMGALSDSWCRRTGPETEYRYAQLRLLRLFETQDWRAMGPVTPVAFPHDWSPWLGERAATTVAGLKALQQAGSVEIVGDVERLDDVSRPYKWPGFHVHRGAPMTAASIIFLARHQGNKLHDMLDGVWRQSFTDFELLIVGGDCDGETRSAVREIADQNPRARFLDCPEESDPGALRHAALGAARGGFIAYLGDDDIWLPHHLHMLAGLLESADFAHGLQASVNKDGGLSVLPCDLSNPDLRHFMATTDHRAFGYALAGHRLDAYRRLTGGWHTIPKDAAWPDLAMWRQFLVEPWCRARSAPVPTGIALNDYWRALLTPVEFAEQVARWRVTCAEPGFPPELDRQAVASLNQQSVAARLALWHSDAQAREAAAHSATNQQREVEQTTTQQTQVISASQEIADMRQALEAERTALRRAEARLAHVQKRLSVEMARRKKSKNALSWRLGRPFRRLIKKIGGTKPDGQRG
jgi:hypothetical protein